MATKATKASAARARARREKQKQGAVDVGNASHLGLMLAICGQLPAPVGEEERRVWNWVLMFDEGWGWSGEPAGLEQHIQGKTGYRLKDDATWRRLMRPEEVAKRRLIRRQVDEAIDKLMR